MESSTSFNIYPFLLKHQNIGKHHFIKEVVHPGKRIIF